MSAKNNNSRPATGPVISLNRKTGLFEAPSTPKRSNNPQARLSESRGLALSPTKTTSTASQSHGGSPVFKRGGTFSNQKRNLLHKSLKDYQSSDPKQMSPAFKARIEKLELYKEASKRYAERMVQTVRTRKEMEQKVSTLENRVKRLKFEDDMLLKKITDTSHKTEKTMKAKIRHQETLIEKEKRIDALARYIEKRKEMVFQEKTIRQDALRESQDDLLRFKFDIGVHMRQENSVGRQTRIQKEEARVVRAKNIVERVRSEERSHYSHRQEKEDNHRYELSHQYLTKVEAEMKKTGELESRLDNLAKLEEQLFTRLSQTQALQKERTFNLRVSSTKIEDGGMYVSKAQSDNTGLRISSLSKTLGLGKSATTTNLAHRLVPDEREEDKSGQKEEGEEEQAQEEEVQEEEAAEEGEEEEQGEEEGEEEAVEGGEEEAEEEEEVVEGEEEAAEEEEVEEYEEVEEEVEA
eukprot:CAMPEP_0176421492 /NCGR_PEP_ID=MMETSP0127-20121128/9203_1 /TAXON_ID=938130 /ORGANISM="Platyophrya macrostoma, Strain WH" /LENGTH=465 /DNA_ID=CAMNT_0017802227 /DNA_START=33 /DNA_END=1431 /DNA_ORIENTATION=-